MSALKDSMRTAGYSQEELYFHKVNQELIEQMKAKGKKAIKKGPLTLVHSEESPSVGDAPDEDFAGAARKKAA